MAQVREQLLKMLRIQQLVLDIQNARSIVESGPGRIEEIEGRFRERNAEYVALKDRHDTLETDRAARALELMTLEDDRKKFMDSLMQVKNQREYAAVLKEIDAVKARISENEETVLKAMEELETLKGELDTHAAHIEAERTKVAEEHAEVEAAIEAAHQSLARAEAERAEVESALPRDLVAAIRRVEEGRRGLFLVKCEREMCTACHVRVRPQVYSEIRQATKLHICSNCRRYLYWERALVDAAPDAPDAPAPGVEALNGGAV
ncbi:MAG TPA: C4-type zinc ribbon domain-containing protein [Candidatus Polarisedimenticolaceae bacterium]